MYSDLNRCFLQYMMNNGIINYEDAEQLLKRLAVRTKDRPKNVRTVLSEINAKISDHLFRIDIRTCEISGNKTCVIVNTCNDSISRLNTGHTASEFEFFEQIVGAIMTSDSKCLSSIACLNLTSRLKTNISKDQAQSKLDLWTKNGYLVKQDGTIYLGARSISEFESYFKSQFAYRMTSCQLCTDHVYFGRICAECSEVIHMHCLAKYLNKNNNCPICKKPWEEAEGRTYEDDNDTADQESMSVDEES